MALDTVHTYQCYFVIKYVEAELQNGHRWSHLATCAAMHQRSVAIESATWRCALGSRVARSPRVSQMCRGSQRFFTASLNEALSNEEAVSGNA